MSSCFPFVRRKQKDNKEVYLVIIGLDNAGKTTTTRSIKGISSDLVAPTIGFDRIEFAVDKFNINLYDLGGGRTIRDIWQTYFAEVHGLIFVVDSSASERLEECQTVLANVLAHPSVSGKPILLLANKRDVEDALPESEIVEALQLDELVTRYQCPCRLERCCALLQPRKKLDKAIKLGLRWLLTYIESALPALESRIAEDTARRAAEQAVERDARRERVRIAREKRERLEKAKRESLEKSAVHSNGDSSSEVRPQADVDNGDICGRRGDVRYNSHLSPRRLTLIDLENREQNGVEEGALGKKELVSVKTSPPNPTAHNIRPSERMKNDKTHQKSLADSRELRRQIDLACSIDFNADDEVTPKHSAESMRLEELDGSDGKSSSSKQNSETEGGSSPINGINLDTTYSKKNGNEPDDAVVHTGRQSICSTAEKNPVGKRSPSSRCISAETDSSLCSTATRMSGVPPRIVDPLYNRGKENLQNDQNEKEPVCHQNTATTEVRSDHSKHSGSAHVTSSGPSALRRVFIPNVNKLHPAADPSKNSSVAKQNDSFEHDGM
ncbi:unnamed protein product [Calicophoron daubneyi]|uniref:ADP-ribosylation factor-like protein 13B n=1 Tax=Calicophoron daubneyi TaxID=300641 RepID=A0AAV2THW7_CALDB